MLKYIVRMRTRAESRLGGYCKNTCNLAVFLVVQEMVAFTRDEVIEMSYISNYLFSPIPPWMRGRAGIVIVLRTSM